MGYQISELRIGGILDQAITLLKNHIGLLLGVTLVLLIPYSLVQNFVNLAIAPQLPEDATFQDELAFQSEFAKTSWITIPMALIAVYIVVPITNAAIIHAVSSEYLEKPTTVGKAMQRAIQMIMPLLWTWFLQILAIVVGLFLCIIPGILFAFWFALSSQVVVIEGTSGIAALQRSRQLMTGNIGTVFVLGILVGSIQWGITLSSAALNLQQHIQVIGQVFAGAIVTIFAAVAFVVFYFSCLCKLENFDLSLLAQSVGIEAAADDAFEE